MKTHCVNIILILSFVVTSVFANPSLEDRSDWYDNESSRVGSDEVTNLKYFKYYDVLPDEITLKAFDGLDMSELAGKKLFVGYGVADPKGKNCKVFTPGETGLDVNTTVCMPWWRIEREYYVSAGAVTETSASIVEQYRKQHPPISVDYCSEWADGKRYPGGTVVCTSYYDAAKDAECAANPEQTRCLVDNCSIEIKRYCEYDSSAAGVQETLPGAIARDGDIIEVHQNKVNLLSHRYDCPAGPLVENVDCTDSQNVLMFPYQCEEDNPTTPSDESEFAYCDTQSPNFSGDSIISFSGGRCSDGRSVECEANSFSYSKKKCIDPIFSHETEIFTREYELSREYTTHFVNVLSGEADIYSEREECLRANTVEDSRDGIFYADIEGSGSLDDDIYVIRHLAGAGGFIEKFYCNMQHAGASAASTPAFKTCLGNESVANTDEFAELALNCALNPDLFEDPAAVQNCVENSPVSVTPESDKDISLSDASKIITCKRNVVDGGDAPWQIGPHPVSCVRNSGSYSFSDTIEIEHGDIVTIQQASEQTGLNGTPFALGRLHYNSTEVRINGNAIIPEINTPNFPHYPNYGGFHLKTWDNTLGSLAILFPFSGYYKLHFYKENGDKLIETTVGQDDFNYVRAVGSKKLNLGLSMELAPGIDEDDANREDPFVEWGGGVYGGKGSVSGDTSSVPNDDYVKNNSAYKIAVEDMMTGRTSILYLAFPIPYPNQIYVSSLQVYEERKYRCYEPFVNIDPVTESLESNKYICSTEQGWIDYENGVTTEPQNVHRWLDNNLCRQNCRSRFGCSESEVAGVAQFTCNEKVGVDIGGDIAGNVFSNKNNCESACYDQNVCGTILETDCVLEEENFYDPVGDYENKTVFTRKNVTYLCQRGVDYQSGCNLWETEDVSGEITYMRDLDWETKDMTKAFEKSVTDAALIDVSNHIFSGWEGKCVSGKKWDFSFLSDPMTIASYAMKIYGTINWYGDMANASADAAAQKAAEAGERLSTAVESGASSAEIAELQSVADSTAQAAAEASDAAANTLSSQLSNTWDDFLSDTGFSDAIDTVNNELVEAWDTVSEPFSGTLEETVSNGGNELIDGANVATNTSGTLSEGLANQVSSLREAVSNTISDPTATLENITGIDWNAYVVGRAGDYFNLTVGDLAMFGAESAFIVMAPAPEQYTLAQRMITGYMGKDDDSDVVAYNMCMASVGASFVNTLGHFYSETDYITEELRYPHMHPLRMTPNQLAAIASVTSEEYVIAKYAVDSKSSNLINVIALDAIAYQKAAQAVCLGPKTFQASQQIQASQGSGAGGDGMAMAIAQAALGAFCPPCSLALSIAMDLMNNVFAKIDTCNNEEDAMQWNMKHFKTQQFLKADQCVNVSSYCDKDTSWYGCVRTGFKKCCFDQITTKIFAAGLKKQLGESFDDSCVGIDFKDMKDVSFRECNPGEHPQTHKCFDTSDYSEFQQTLFRQSTKNVNRRQTQGLMNQLRDSMALD